MKKHFIRIYSHLLIAGVLIFAFFFTNAISINAQHLSKIPHTLEYSPDGRFIAASGQGFVHVWDTPTQTQILQLDIGETFVFEISWSADSARLVTGSDDQYVRIWNIDGFDFSRGELITEFVPFPDGLDLVTTVTYSPDGLLIAVGGIADGQSLKLYDATSFELMTPVRLGWVEQVVWNPNPLSPALFVSYQDAPPLIYAFALSGQERRRAISNRDVPSGAATWNHNGTQIAVGYIDGIIQIWHVSTNRQITPLAQTSHYSVADIAWSQIDNLIAAADGDAARLWNSIDGSLMMTFSKSTRVVAFNPISGDLALGLQNGELNIIPRRSLIPCKPMPIP